MKWIQYHRAYSCYAIYNIRHSHNTNSLQLFTVPLLKRYCADSSSSNSDKDEKTKIKEEKNLKQEVAQKRLKDLLLSFNKSKARDPTVKVENYRPTPKRDRKPQEVKEDQDDDRAIAFAMKRAVKDVAKHLGGDAKSTETELIASVKSHSKAKENLSDLLSKMEIGADQDTRQKLKTGIASAFSKGPGEEAQAWMRPRTKQTVDIFGAAPLGIFKPVEQGAEAELSQPKASNIWDAAYERDLQMAVSHPPRNYFEEMIQWTEKGIFWPFPIDNEFGLEEEKSLNFADHIFLERHLEGWCPQKGPIRHFMELVCVGLSKNPYVTLARKKAHIEWYKNYFEGKKEILQSVGAT